jgi:hypothetical protein
MGVFSCLCGNRISDVVQPNSCEGVLLTGYRADQSEPEEAICSGAQIWECDRCGNLIMQLRDGTLRHYRPADGKAIGLFQPDSPLDD